MHATLTIDDQGRIVLPQDLREELHLAAGDTLEMQSSGMEISLRPAHEGVRLVYEQGIPVFYSGAPLSPTIVEDIIDQIREERDLQNLGLLE